MEEFFASSMLSDHRIGFALLAICAGGLIRGFTGFGSALVVIPTLAILFGPKEAVVMHAIMEIPVVVSLMPSAIRNSERSVTVPMLLALTLTAPIGAMVLLVIAADLLNVIISTVILCTVVLLMFQQQVSAFLSRSSTIAAGAVGGLLQGATGVGGPPIVMALIARGDSARISRANIIVVASMVLVISLISFAALGLVTRDVAVVGIVASPFSVAATYLGSLLFKQVGRETHRGVTLVVLAITALLTLITVVLPST